MTSSNTKLKFQIKKATKKQKETAPVAFDDIIDFEGEAGYLCNLDELLGQDGDSSSIASKKHNDREDCTMNGHDAETRSIYIKNIDFSTTPANLEEFFFRCGEINRITLLCDKYTGQPKG